MGARKLEISHAFFWDCTYSEKHSQQSKNIKRAGKIRLSRAQSLEQPTTVGDNEKAAIRNCTNIQPAAQPFLNKAVLNSSSKICRVSSYLTVSKFEISVKELYPLGAFPFKKINYAVPNALPASITRIRIELGRSATFQAG
jgi:hypothetical protein